MEGVEKLNRLIGRKLWFASSDVYDDMAGPHIELMCREWRGFHVEPGDDIHPICRDTRYVYRGAGEEDIAYSDDIHIYSQAIHGVDRCIELIMKDLKGEESDFGHAVRASSENREEAVAKCIAMWKDAMERRK